MLTAAATAMEKMANITPCSASGFALYLQKAMKFRFAALSINSTPMSTTMALRRVNTPARPMQNSSAETSR